MDELAFGELLFAPKKSRLPIIVLYALIFILLLLVLFYYYLGSAIVKGSSMENTLVNGQRTLLLRNGYTVERGDIVTLTNGDDTLIKRVIGLGGDKILYVRSEDGNYVDLYICRAGETHFSAESQSYIKERMEFGVIGEIKPIESVDPVTVLPHESQSYIKSIDLADGSASAQKLNAAAVTVPNDSFYFLGDNRNNSSDSRKYGAFPITAISGKVVKIAAINSAMEKFINIMFVWASVKE